MGLEVKQVAQKPKNLAFQRVFVGDQSQL
jgi:hypothetical protein